MEKFLQLRKENPEFIYHSFEINETGFSYHFSIGEYHFYPSWKWNGSYIDKDTDLKLLQTMVFSLGMAELVSYWKCACPPTVLVKCGALDEFQINWWKKLYYNGLGEFFYRNGIKTDFDSFMKIIPDSTDVPRFTETGRERKGALIPVGGGKDSVVSLELLSGMKNYNLCYIINPRGATLNCAHTAGYSDEQIIGLSRTIDKGLLERNAAGWLNGHTPFSAIVAFSSYICAVLTGKKYIALSNESSANESYVEGTDINHQYSKSTEFERDFREYTSRYFLSCPEYFSLLRPLSEWQIAREFVKHPKYFPVFQSCNLGSKTDIWCGKCAKCLYVYILLSAFLTDDVLVKIFGCNMLDNPEFLPMFDGLVLDGEDKPFECVGTKAEVRLSLNMALSLRKNNPPALLKAYYGYKEIGGFDIPDLSNFFDNDNFVPTELLPFLKGK